METTLLDQLILLLTGLTAVYLIYRFLQAIKGTTEKAKYYYHYIVSFAVLFVSGVLIILFDFAVLARPEIKIVATLIPFALATGLMCQFYQKYAKFYAMFLLKIKMVRIYPGWMTRMKAHPNLQGWIMTAELSRPYYRISHFYA